MSLDFTLQRYEMLCQAILESGYQPMPIAQYIIGQSAGENTVVLRHDVDRRPANALHMAQLENRLGIHSTYYFRHTKNVFKPGIIREISKLGHEIGYHYETLSKSRGDQQAALSLFTRELSEFRQFADVTTISMHGSPLSPFDNRDLWLKNDFHTFGLIGEAYISINYEKIQYFTDTGRTWKRTYYNLRDHTPQMSSHEQITSTDQLISAIRDKLFPQYCISTHPERWAGNFSEWSYSLMSDLAANVAKTLIRSVSRKNQ
jgi:hypothetical protein